MAKPCKISIWGVWKKRGRPISEPVYVAISIDVEEEGLFSGQYKVKRPGLRNLACLGRLEPFLRRGVRPTLFCTANVFEDPVGQEQLSRLGGRYPLELGAHLHHWNNPPLATDEAVLEHVPSGKVPFELMQAKLDYLFERAAKFIGAPARSFRMGRWDLHRAHWPLLARNGIRCDASVRPLHAGARNSCMPDHFFAPTDPYIANMEGQTILEVPLTVVPLAGWLPSLGKLPLLGAHVKRVFRHCAAMPFLSVEYPLWLLKWLARKHLARGGRCLSFTWHSSEMMPGGAPHMSSQLAVDKFLHKMDSFLSWLELYRPVRYVTMSELAETPGLGTRIPPIPAGDWLCLD